MGLLLLAEMHISLVNGDTGWFQKKKKKTREEQKRRKKKPSGVSLRSPDAPFLFLLLLMINALLPSRCRCELPSARDVALTAEKLLQV